MLGIESQKPITIAEVATLRSFSNKYPLFPITRGKQHKLFGESFESYAGIILAMIHGKKLDRTYYVGTRNIDFAVVEEDNLVKLIEVKSGNNFCSREQLKAACKQGVPLDVIIYNENVSLTSDLQRFFKDYNFSDFNIRRLIDFKEYFDLKDNLAHRYVTNREKFDELNKDKRRSFISNLDECFKFIKNKNADVSFDQVNYFLEKSLSSSNTAFKELVRSYV